MIESIYETLFKPASEEDVKQRRAGLFKELHAVADFVIDESKRHLSDPSYPKPYSQSVRILKHVELIMDRLGDMVTGDVISIDAFSVARSVMPRNHTQTRQYLQGANKFGEWIKRNITQ